MYRSMYHVANSRNKFGTKRNQESFEQKDESWIADVTKSIALDMPTLLTYTDHICTESKNLSKFLSKRERNDLFKTQHRPGNPYILIRLGNNICVGDYVHADLDLHTQHTHTQTHTNGQAGLAALAVSSLCLDDIDCCCIWHQSTLLLG